MSRHCATARLRLRRSADGCVQPRRRMSSSASSAPGSPRRGRYHIPGAGGGKARHSHDFFDSGHKLPHRQLFVQQPALGPSSWSTCGLSTITRVHLIPPGKGLSWGAAILAESTARGDAFMRCAVRQGENQAAMGVAEPIAQKHARAGVANGAGEWVHSRHVFSTGSRVACRVGRMQQAAVDDDPGGLCVFLAWRAWRFVEARSRRPAFPSVRRGGPLPRSGRGPSPPGGRPCAGWTGGGRWQWWCGLAPGYPSAFWISFSVSVSTAEVASSRIRMRGSISSARAMRMRWRSPPDRPWPRSPTSES